MLFDRPIPVPTEDNPVHTNHDPLCSDSTSPDTVDSTLLAQVAQQLQDGLLTPEEATRFVQGRQLSPCLAEKEQPDVLEPQTRHTTPLPEVSPALEESSTGPLSTHWIPLHELITHWTEV